MTEYICTCDAMCVEPKRTPFTTVFWNNLRRLVETLGAEVLEIYRWNNDPQPQFSNGGTRVLIRPDRIDLV